MDKKQSRIRRGKKARMHMRTQRKISLCVHRTPKHIYAQVISEDADTIIAAASTVEKALTEKLSFTGNIAAAEAIGEAIALRAKEQGVSEVAFDRSGFAYHGRVKALAESARKHGLKF